MRKSSGVDTWFPGVAENELSVKATRGSAVFFWNTLENPGSKDYAFDMFLNADKRLRHAGVPVCDDSTSEKWVCNWWIHPTDLGSGVRGVQDV